MSKNSVVYVCSSCSAKSPQWSGKCHSCNSWNSLEEESKRIVKAKAFKENQISKTLLDINLNSVEKTKTGIAEFDRVLGGGITKGSLVLIGGEPGIGKSTLITKVMDKLSVKNKILYVSGEESESQVAQRATRLNVNTNNFYILNESSWQLILSEINRLKPKFIVIDSIQTTVSDEISSAPGTTSQIREVTHELMNQIKAKDISCFIVGHITKEGSIAGPKVLEHMVDTVLYFEGDQFDQYRIIRSMKNRFGSTNEIGLFEMSHAGLIEVKNPSKYFINDDEYSYGKTLSCILEGTRPLLIESQALVVGNKFGAGRRIANGLDSNRVIMIVAIIEKYMGITLSENDIYVNIAGGLKLTQRESDLSLLVSIISSYKKNKIQPGTVYIGEVGLTGEVGSVPQIEKRLNELNHLNLKKLFVSSKSKREINPNKYSFEILEIDNVKNLEKYL